MVKQKDVEKIFLNIYNKIYKIKYIKQKKE